MSGIPGYIVYLLTITGTYLSGIPGYSILTSTSIGIATGTENWDLQNPLSATIKNILLNLQKCIIYT